MIETTRIYKQRFLEEAGTLLKVGVPVIIAQLLQMSMSFVDTVMAGRLSATDLAAVAVGSSVLLPFVVLCLGCMMAVSPIVAQNIGGREFHLVGKNARQVLWLSQILALPSFFILRNLEIVMTWLEVSNEVIPVADGYLKAISWGMFPAYAYGALRYFNEGLSVTRPAMYVALVGVLVNIPANYVLMYGKLGLPQLGAVGTGYASSIVFCVMFAGMAWFTSTFGSYQRFEIFKKFRWPEFEYFREMLRIGIPIGISSTMEVTFFALVSLLMGSIGTVAVAGHQVAINFAAMTFMVPFGLSIAITARVGNAAGKQDKRTARFRGFTGVLICTSFMSLTAVLMYLFPVEIASIYTSDTDVIAIAVQLIYMAAIFQISDGLQVSGFGALRGLKDTKVPMFVNLFAYWIVGLPVAWILGFTMDLGPQGLWIGLIFGLTVAAFLHNARFWQQTKR